MIVRAALAIGLVWLAMPHHPDLGLTATAAAPGETERQVVIARLREVRKEIETQKTGQGNLAWNDRGAPVPRTSSRFTGEIAPYAIVENALGAMGFGHDAR